ncbi:MAG: hypothetical protein K8R52_09450, partial [Bacteroidales bacterium]|nr:hypothetical protein [Bacteroidales bacterium]
STFPAIVSGIIGMLIGKLYLTVKDENKRLVWLFFVGFLMFLAGGLWNWVFPLNKNIWTSSYVLYTSGLGTQALAGSCPKSITGFWLSPPPCYLPCSCSNPSTASSFPVSWLSSIGSPNRS